MSERREQGLEALDESHFHHRPAGCRNSASAPANARSECHHIGAECVRRRIAHEAGQRLIGEIVSGVLGIPDAPDDPEHPQLRHARAQRVGIETETRQRRGTLTGDEHVGVGEEGAEARLAVLALQVEPLDRDAGVHLGMPGR